MPATTGARTVPEVPLHSPARDPTCKARLLPGQLSLREGPEPTSAAPPVALQETLHAHALGERMQGTMQGSPSDRKSPDHNGLTREWRWTAPSNMGPKLRGFIGSNKP